jgi:hypothetical protein
MKRVQIVLIFIISIIFCLISCATTDGGFEALSAQGVDVFAGKNWNAPRRNNMYDRWEFDTDGTFRFWHVHHGTPLDRGIYRYEVKDGLLTVVKDGTEENAFYTYSFKGNTVTLIPVSHNAAEQGKRQMGAMPESQITFTNAR